MSGPYDLSTYDDTVTNSSGTFVKNVLLAQANADRTRFAGNRWHMRAAHTRLQPAGARLAPPAPLVFPAGGGALALDRRCGDTLVSTALGTPFFQAPRYTGGVAASPADINGRRRNFRQLWVRADDDLQSATPLQLDADALSSAIGDYRFGVGGRWGWLLNPTTLDGDLFDSRPTLAGSNVAPLFNSFLSARVAGDPIRGPIGQRAGRMDSLADVFWLFNDRTRTVWRTRTGWACSLYGLPSEVEIWYNALDFYYYTNPPLEAEVKLYLEEEVVSNSGGDWGYSYPSTLIGTYTPTVANDWYWAGGNNAISWNWTHTETSPGTLSANSIGYRYKLVARYTIGGGGETTYSNVATGSSRCGVWHKLPPSGNALWGYPGGDGELAGVGAGLIVDLDAH